MSYYTKMSYNVCIYQSLRKRIADEVNDVVQWFTNHFQQLLNEIDETQKLFQLDDCTILMDEGDDEPCCQLYHNLFRTLNHSLDEVWHQLKLTSATLSCLREESQKRRRFSFLLRSWNHSISRYPFTFLPGIDNEEKEKFLIPSTNETTLVVKLEPLTLKSQSYKKMKIFISDIFSTFI